MRGFWIKKSEKRGRKMFRKFLAAIVCVMAGFVFVGCSPAPAKTYQLNKSEITYTLGNDFSDMGLYLVNDKNPADRILVTKSMFADQEALTTISQNVNAKIVYNGKDYYITLTVKSVDNGQTLSAIREFLEKAKTQGVLGNAEFSTNLATKYLGENGSVVFNGSTELASQDYIANLLSQYVMGLLLEAPRLEDMNGMSADYRILATVEQVLEDLMSIDGKAVKLVVKNVIDEYLLTESDEFYQDSLALLLVNEFGIKKTAEVGLRVLINENFQYFKNVEWEKLNFNSILELLLDEQNRKSGFEIDAITEATAESMLLTLQEYDGRLSTVLECMRPLFLAGAGKVVYGRVEVVEGETRYYGFRYEQITDSVEVEKMDAYFDARVRLVRNIEALGDGADLKTMLEKIKTNLNFIQGENQYFIDNKWWVAGGIIDTFLPEEYTKVSYDYDAYYYVLKNTANQKLDMILTVLQMYVDEALVAVEKEGNFWENYALGLLNAGVLSVDSIAFISQVLADELLLDEAGKADIEALLTNNLSGKTAFKEFSEINLIGMYDEFRQIICDHSGAFDLMEASEEEITLLKNYMAMPLSSEGVVAFVSENKEALKPLLADFLAYAILEDEANMPKIEAFVEDLLNSISDETITVREVVFNAFALVSEVSYADVRMACAEIEKVVKGALIASEIYAGKIDLKAEALDKLVIPFLTDRVAKAVGENGTSATTDDKAFIAEVLDVFLNDKSLKEYVLVDEAGFKASLKSVISKYMGTQTYVSKYVDDMVFDIKSGGFTLKNAIAVLRTDVAVWCGEALRLDEDIKPYKDYMDGAITLEQLGDKLGFFDSVTNDVFDYMFGEDAIPNQEFLNFLENIIKNVIFEKGTSEFLTTNQQYLAGTLTNLVCKVLDIEDLDGVEAVEDFCYKYIGICAKGTFSVESFISEFTALVDTVCDENMSANVKAVILFVTYINSIATGQEVDYNKIFEYVELPEYIESVDFNKLFNKIAEGNALDDIITVKTSQIDYITDTTQKVVGQVLTLTLNVDFDAIFAGISGDITLKIYITA